MPEKPNRRQHEADTPFFVWVNTTHMHFRTHTREEDLGRAVRWQSPYGIVSHNDWLVTLLAAAGNPDIGDRLEAGVELGSTQHKVHLDGFNQLDYITAQAEHSAASPLLLRVRRRRPHGSDHTRSVPYDWLISHAFLLVAAQQYVAGMLRTLASSHPARSRHRSASTRSWRS